MASVEESVNSLDQAIEEFAAEVRRGNDPAIDQYASRYPACASEIRRLFPAVELMERCGCETAREARFTNSVPQWLGDYEIVREIGRGGMGVVYEARQASLLRRVALKVLPTAVCLRPEAVNRFRQEAMAAARLHHTNIAQVYDVGQSNGHHFYVMQYIDGEPLAELCARSPAATGESADGDWIRFVAQVGLQAGAALAHAHAQGVLHRDVKPSNLLVDAHDIVWITDFGLAKIDGIGDLTTTGDVPGTMRYLAPERLRGQADVRSDVFGLGLVLYELLTGRPAFNAADRAELLKQVNDSSPPAPGRLASGIPHDLETIVFTCLEHDPARRYQSAEELAKDCRRFLEDRPIAARRSSPAERLVRWSRRNRAIAASLGAVALLLAVMTVGSLLAAAHFRRQEGLQRELTAQAETAARDARIARINEVALSEEFRSNLYIAEMNLAGQIADSPNGMRRILELLAKWECAEPDLRGWEWHYLKSLCHGDRLLLQGQWGGVNGLAYSPDGTRLVSGGGDQTLRIWDAESAEEIMSWRGHRDRLTAIAWSPDGSRIASASWDRTVKIWDATNGRELLTLRGHDRGVTCVAWSPDGKKLASGGADDTIRIWVGDNGKEQFTLRGHEKVVTAIAWSSTGTELVSAAGDARVIIWNLMTREKSLDYSGHAGSTVTSLGWSPDGRRIASGSDAATIKIWNPKNGEDFATLKGHNGSVDTLAWNAQGTQLVSGCRYDRTIRVWEPFQGRELYTLRSPNSGVSSATWAPDGTRLASASVDGAIKIWNSLHERHKEALHSHQDLITGIDWNHDGSQLASASWDGTTRIWKVDAAEEAATLRGPNLRRHAGVDWSPDGGRLAWGDEDGAVNIHDFRQGREIVLRGCRGGMNAVAWSPDGRRIAGAGEGQTISVWDVATGVETAVLVGNSSGVSSLAWSPDGTCLASAGWDWNLRVWDLSQDHGEIIEPCHNLAGHNDILRCVVWSPDGRRLATAGDDGAIKLWDASEGIEKLTLHGHSSAVYAISWSHDGKRLVSGGLDKAIKIWDPNRGWQLLTLRAGEQGVTAVAWSPDGMQVAYATAANAVYLLNADPRR